MAKKKQDSGGGDIPEWVMTYGDLMSLLLCFFILLAAFSEIKKPREYQEVINAIQEALGVNGGDSNVLEELDLAKSPITDILNATQSHTETKSTRSDTNEQSTNGKDSQTSKLMEEAKWTIGKPILFEADSAALDDTTKGILKNEVAPKIRDSQFIFIVEGHAWGAEDRISGRDATEMSYERARAVVDYLVDECDVDRKLLALFVAGDSQPLTMNGQSAAGISSNRRVEIFQTGVTIDALNPDPYGTGRGN